MKAIKKKEISPTNGSEKLLSGLEEEKLQFKKIQSCFAEQFDKAFPDKLAPKTVIIIPLTYHGPGNTFQDPGNYTL
jgi:hypothetical protein